MLSVVVKLAFAVICMSQLSLAELRLEVLTERLVRNALKQSELGDAAVMQARLQEKVNLLTRNSTGNIIVVLADGPLPNNGSVFASLATLRAATDEYGIETVLVSFVAADGEILELDPSDVKIGDVLELQGLMAKLYTNKQDSAAYLLVPKRMFKEVIEEINLPERFVKAMNNIETTVAGFSEYHFVKTEILCSYLLKQSFFDVLRRTVRDLIFGHHSNETPSNSKAKTVGSRPADLKGDGARLDDSTTKSPTTKSSTTKSSTTKSPTSESQTTEIAPPRSNDNVSFTTITTGGLHEIDPEPMDD